MTAVLPFTAPDLPALSALARATWADSPQGPGIARLAGVDPGRVEIRVSDGTHLPTGLLWLWGQTPAHYPPTSMCDAALAAMGGVLEGHGYAVDWTGAGPRVVGWAAEIAAFEDNHVAGHDEECRPLVRLIDIEEGCPWDERVLAWREDLARARLARRPPVVEPGTQSRGEMAARREAGRR